MRFNNQPITGVDIGGSEMPALAPTVSNSLSVTGSVGNPFAVSGLSYAFNETNWEFIRGNTDQTIMAASSVSASTAVTVVNYGAGIIAWAEITSGLPPGSASVTFALKVQAISPVGTSRFVTLAATTARSATGIVAVMVYPGISETSGAAIAKGNWPCPRNLRILASISSGAASFGMVLAIGMSTLK